MVADPTWAIPALGLGLPLLGYLYGRRLDRQDAKRARGQRPSPPLTASSTTQGGDA